MKFVAKGQTGNTEVSICSVNDLVPNNRQAINWANGLGTVASYYLDKP